MDWKAALVECRLIYHDWTYYADENERVTAQVCSTCGLEVPRG